MSKDQVENWIKEFYQWAICFDQYIKRVTSLDDVYLTVKFFLTVLAVNTMSSWFCDCLAIWLGILALKPLVLNLVFAYSPIYNMNKDLIDNTYEMVVKSATEYYELVKSLIPKYEEKREQN